MRNVVLLCLTGLLFVVQYSAAQNRYICKKKEDGVYFDSNDGCSSCVCNDRVLTCESQPCPALYCETENQVKKKGECCPSCKSGCDSEEFGYIKAGASKSSKNRCTTCSCSEDSELECVSASCLECTGHWTDDGTCCGHCDMSQCKMDGKVYENGEEVKNDDPCSECHCLADGEHVEVMCIMKLCDQCQGKWIDDGSCCGHCEPPVCKYKKKTYNISEDIPTKDKCSRCSCAQVGNEAEVICAVMDCFPCPGRTIKDGSCCGKCEPACMVKGEFYDVGIEVPEISPCESCMCEMMESGPEVICMPMVCAILCPDGQELVKNDDSCCGHCEDIMIPLPDCDVIKCEEPNCPTKQQYTPVGECCAQCQCKYSKKTVNPGPFMDDCNTCMCKNGEVKCSPPDCPRKILECVDAELGEDCCYHCPNGKTCAHPKVKGIVIKYGEYMKVKSDYCHCAGDPWYPLAFCTKSKMPKTFLKKFGDQVADRMDL